ncbi:nuclear receptor binding SET domain protein [Phlebotomus argentipes]|uniref:nuclear receptor binding SET domain protein n=1 Tax=Phlebotomus argentipes TaxID=94469 RepID=UPI00289352FE|nr:nuclear receptor binding SET domain protein [Phlebotomus argentipes]
MNCIEAEIPLFVLSKNPRVLLTSLIEQPEKSEMHKNAEEFPPGSLLWASLSKTDIFWPSILMESLSTDENSKYHVKFFGDLGRNGLISKSNVRKFVRKDKDLALQNASKAKISGFSKRIARWEVAVREAEDCLQYPIEERIQMFTKAIEKQKTLATENLKRKRQSDPWFGRKKLKLDDRKKSTELSESGISTGSVSPTPTLDLMSNGTATPIRVTPEPTVKPPPRVADVKEFFSYAKEQIQEDLAMILKKCSRAVCRFCGSSTAPLIRCSGRCGDTYHAKCTRIKVNVANRSNRSGKSLAEEEIESESVNSQGLCCECSDGEKICFACTKPIKDEVLTCSERLCSRSFHRHCLKGWPQVRITQSNGKDTFICPQHMCHICSSDDPSQHSIDKKMRLLKCILCPTTYHNASQCIPAGSEVLSSHRLICPRHWPLTSKQINVNWCFICVKGGTLICCDNCPGAVHESCALASATDDPYLCDDCESGRTLVYGNLVWAKQGSHRWWPALIVTASCAPQIVQNARHRRGEICTYFLGSHNWAWLPRKRMFQYQEDDGECHSKTSESPGGLNKSFYRALNEATQLSRMTNVHMDITNHKHERPPMYKKLLNNQLVAPVKARDLIVEEEMVDTRCFCNTVELVDKCGPMSSCVNRISLIECTNSSCGAGSECQNRSISRRQYAATQVIRTPRCGWGLVTKQALQEGDFVVEYVGEIINAEEAERRIRKKQEERSNVYYLLTLTKDLTIDAEHKGNHSRFINHSCDPNCITQKWSVNGVIKIGIFAIKDIPEGTELTFNYQWEKRGAAGMICQCGAQKCLGSIGSEPKKTSKTAIKRKIDENLNNPEPHPLNVTI